MDERRVGGKSQISMTNLENENPEQKVMLESELTGYFTKTENLLLSIKDQTLSSAGLDQRILAYIKQSIELSKKINKLRHNSEDFTFDVVSKGQWVKYQNENQPEV